MTKEEKSNAVKAEGIGLIFVMLKLRQENDSMKRMQLKMLGRFMCHQIRLIQSQPLHRPEHIKDDRVAVINQKKREVICDKNGKLTIL